MKEKLKAGDNKAKFVISVTWDQFIILRSKEYQPHKSSYLLNFSPNIKRSRKICSH